KSTQRYHAFDPDEEHGGDFTQLVGEPCIVTIVNNKSRDGNVYDNVATIAGMRPKDARSAPPLVNEPRVLSLDEENTELFLSLPEWIQERIKSGLEWESTNLYKALQEARGSSGTQGSQEKEKPVSESPKRSKKVVVEDEEGDDDLDDSIPFEADGLVEENENW